MAEPHRTEVVGDPVQVTPAMIDAYAAALGLDVDPSGSAPSLLPTVTSWAPMLAVVLQVVAEADPPMGIVLTRHHAALHRALQIGDVATSTAWAARRAGIPQGTLLEVAHDTSVGGELVAEQRTILLLVGRGGTAEDRALVREGAQVPAGGDETSSALAIAADLPSRYAAASGDDNPIHLDDEAARAAGLPGVVVHGMAVLALALDAAVRHAGGAMPKEVGAQFGRPVLPGDELTVTTWPGEGEDVVVGLRAATAAGTVLKRARVRFAP